MQAQSRPSKAFNPANEKREEVQKMLMDVFDPFINQHYNMFTLHGDSTYESLGKLHVEGNQKKEGKKEFRKRNKQQTNQPTLDGWMRPPETA